MNETGENLRKINKSGKFNKDGRINLKGINAVRKNAIILEKQKGRIAATLIFPHLRVQKRSHYPCDRDATEGPLHNKTHIHNQLFIFRPGGPMTISACNAQIQRVKVLLTVIKIHFFGMFSET
ncbi:hypothetical protein [Pseudocitrobacter vendiensis]|uniref:hypothetical protein n=1 Tax=Pseudocitrobacter vendiensis TaxID=2488306 RepID=UPI0020A5DC39|nr:hypothetical protein [Pseudocitrobacter vendiensis]